jgi:hypothetical protein
MRSDATVEWFFQVSEERNSGSWQARPENIHVSTFQPFQDLIGCYQHSTPMHCSVAQRTRCLLVVVPQEQPLLFGLVWLRTKYGNNRQAQPGNATTTCAPFSVQEMLSVSTGQRFDGSNARRRELRDHESTFPNTKSASFDSPTIPLSPIHSDAFPHLHLHIFPRSQPPDRHPPKTPYYNTPSLSVSTSRLQ